MADQEVHCHHFCYVPVFFIVGCCEELALELQKRLLLVTLYVYYGQEEEQTASESLVLSEDQRCYC